MKEKYYFHILLPPIIWLHILYTYNTVTLCRYILKPTMILQLYFCILYIYVFIIAFNFGPLFSSSVWARRDFFWNIKCLLFWRFNRIALLFEGGRATIHITVQWAEDWKRGKHAHKRPNKRVNRRKREKRFLIKLAPTAGSFFFSGSPSFHSRRFFSLFIISKDFRN